MPITASDWERPSWAPGVVFQYDFKVAGGSLIERGDWTDSDYTLASSSGLTYESSALLTGSDEESLYKEFTSLPSFWIRFYIRVVGTLPTGSHAILQYGYVEGSGNTAKVTGSLVVADNEATLSIVTLPSTGAGFSLPLAKNEWYCIELHDNKVERLLTPYINGVEMGGPTGYLSTTPDTGPAYLQISVPAAYTTGKLQVDALCISRQRVGPVGDPGPISQSFDFRGEVSLAGVPLLVRNHAYREGSLSSFNPRLGVGAPNLSDLSGFQHFAWESFHHGLGQCRFSDEAMYAFSYGVDPTEAGYVRLQAKLYNISAFEPKFYRDGNARIVHEVTPAYTLLGLQKGKVVSGSPASENVLMAYAPNGASVTAWSTTNDTGIEDIYYNGSYIFVSVGGAAQRWMKSAYSATIGSLSWTNAGSSSVVPYDMGQMESFDQFLWVAERARAVLHRCAEVDGSDLEGAGDALETFVGQTNIPITALKAYLGSLWVGKEDGLYRVWMDGTNVYQKCELSVTRHPDNFKGMTIYNGLLTYSVNKRIYQFNGTSQLDITPGPVREEVDATYGHPRIQRVGNFYADEDYLFCAASYFKDDESGCLWTPMVYNGAGWHVVAAYPGGTYFRQVMPSVLRVYDSSNNPSVQVAELTEVGVSTWAVVINRHSGELGFDPPSSGHYVSSGFIVTSWVDFGLPLVSRMLRLVRVLADNIGEPVGVAGTHTSLYLEYQTEEDTTTWHALGYIASSDCDFIDFPPGTICNRVRFRITLNSDANFHESPVLRAVVVQYMDRPATVWGVDITVDLPASAGREIPVNYVHSSPLSQPALVNFLKDQRDSLSPVTFRDPTGNEFEVYLTDVQFYPSTPSEAEALSHRYAKVTLMGVSGARFLPPATTKGLDITWLP